MTETQWYLTRRADKKGAPSSRAATDDAFGPLTTESLLKLASSGKVGADALVWIDGTDVLFTLAQFQEMASAGKIGRPAKPKPPPLPPAEALPDWLAEMAAGESRAPARHDEPPDWLEDVRHNEELAATARQPPPAARQPVARTPQRPPVPPSTPVSELSAVPLDWLEDIQQIEESLRARPALPIPPKEPALAPPPVPVVEPLKMALPVPVQPVPPPLPVPEVRVVPPPIAPVPAAPGVPALPDPLVTGYDAETGRILDAAKYARYQKAESQRRQQEAAQPSLSVAEVFIQAHRALQDWVDAEENKPIVCEGDLDVIRAWPAIGAIMARYANYGAVMRERLEKRLAVLVENRKKFLKAFGLA
jgi:hypothetical protein